MCALLASLYLAMSVFAPSIFPPVLRALANAPSSCSVVPTQSMFPTLINGDALFVDAQARAPRRGEVILFRYPLDLSRRYVKRVVGLPGDVIQVKDGHVVVNDREWPRTLVRRQCATTADGVPEIEVGVPCVLWEESAGGQTHRIATDTTAGEADFARAVVPPGHIFVMGDNRENSSDSRAWGTVDQALVEGTVRFVWYSMARGGFRWERFGLPVR